MNKKIWLIYKHTNKINGKCYIGQTRTTLKDRWKNGKGYSKYQTLLINAINKYGWENFDHEILEQNILSQEEADAREQYWISHYHSYINDPNCNGYNMTPGGSTCSIHRIKICFGDDIFTNKIIYDVELNNYEKLGWRQMTKAEVKKLYYVEHHEELLEKSRVFHKQYRIEHCDQLRERNRTYAKENSEKVKAKQLEWTLANKEYLKQYKENWTEQNKDRLQEKAKTYYQEHREEILAKRKIYAEANKEKIREYKKNYRKNKK